MTVWELILAGLGFLLLLMAVGGSPVAGDLSRILSPASGVAHGREKRIQGAPVLQVSLLREDGS